MEEKEGKGQERRAHNVFLRVLEAILAFTTHKTLSLLLPLYYLVFFFNTVSALPFENFWLRYVAMARKQDAVGKYIICIFRFR